MSITVSNALKLNTFKEAKVIAGKSGLQREITRISVAECPEFPIDPVLNAQYNLLFKQGDFLLTSFFAIKDKPKEIFETVKLYNDYQSSGLCVIDLYIKQFPKYIIDYADKHNYPIIQIRQHVSYAEIISDIMEAIIQNKEDTILELKVDHILYSAKTEDEVTRTAFSMNSNFKKYFICLYCKVEQKNEKNIQDIRERLHVPKECLVLKYKEGILLILSFDKNSNNNIQSRANYTIQEILSIYPSINIGISDICMQISKLNECIHQSLIACDLTQIENKTIISYNETGIYKFLIALKNKKELKEFYNSVMVPLKEYDQKHNTELVRTAVYFIDHDGDLKKTAKCLFQHENTIRYRIAKMKKILDMPDANIKFYEQLSIAVKIEKVLFRRHYG